jgi:hypothetical protein
MKTIAPRKTEITVKRPDGKIETLIHPKVDYMTPAIWSQITKAMRDANRGECVSYRNIDAVVEMEESDYQGHCERCGTAIDTRKTYHQQERMSFGGGTVKVAAYYCNHCRQLLTEIGKGEYTPMQERATDIPDNTPTYKED